MNDLNHLYTQAIAMTVLAVVTTGPIQPVIALVAVLHAGLFAWGLFREDWS